MQKKWDHPYEDDEDLAKSGYKPNMKQVQNFNHPSTFLATR